VTDSLDEAADLLMKSKTNVRMVVSKLEVDLGRHLDLPTVPGPTAADEGKLLLVRLPKRSRSQLTGVGASPPSRRTPFAWLIPLPELLCSIGLRMMWAELQGRQHYVRTEHHGANAGWYRSVCLCLCGERCSA